MQILHSNSGETFRLQRKIGSGGEGEIYTIENQPEFAAKLYFPHRLQGKEEKIREMIPLCPEDLRKFAAIPLKSLYDSNNEFVGFLMDFVGGEPFHEFVSKSRHTKFPNARWNFFVKVAKNLALTIQALHDTQFIVGDINESNIFVLKNATVKIIDCDSFQFQSLTGTNFPCEVGKTEYLAPELQDGNWGIWRTKNHDYFGLSVVIFQILFINRHPFSGIPTTNRDDSFKEAIKNHRFAFGSDSKNRGYLPPPHIINLEEVSKPIEEFFRTAFLQDEFRPTAKDWITALDNLEKNLRRCSENNGHFYPHSILKCPWCRIEEESNFQAVHFEPLSFDTDFVINTFWEEVSSLPIPANTIPNAFLNFKKILQDITSKKNDYDNLGTFRATRLQELEQQAQERQKTEFLSKFRIADASIPKIGYSRTVTLRNFGIETAADLSKPKIYSVPGFGYVYTSNLINWRDEKLRMFVFNPTSAISVTDQRMVESEIYRRRISLEKDLKKGKKELERIISEAKQEQLRREQLSSYKVKKFIVEKLRHTQQKVKTPEKQTGDSILNSYTVIQDANYKKARNFRIYLGLAIFVVGSAVFSVIALLGFSPEFNLVNNLPKDLSNNNLSAINTDANSLVAATPLANSANANILVNANIVEPEDVKNYKKGLSFSHKGQFGEAVKFYELAISLNPNNAQAQHGLGYALLKLGKYQESIIASNKALSLKPKNAETYKNLGLAYELTKDLNSACLNFQKAHKLMPNDLASLFQLNNCLAQKGDYSEALISFEEMIKKKPINAQLRYEYAKLLLKQARNEDATAQYDEILKLDLTLAAKLAQEMNFNFTRQRVVVPNNSNVPER